jgi:hypothetical protein
MPFEELALTASVDRLLTTAGSSAPGFETGYAQWQSAKGGIYTISVSKAVEIMFEALKPRGRA